MDGKLYKIPEKSRARALHFEQCDKLNQWNEYFEIYYRGDVLP